MRKHVLTVAALLLVIAAFGFAGGAQEDGQMEEPTGWQAEYPELVFGVGHSESDADKIRRYGPLMDYLSRELGVKVVLRSTSDYASSIEGMKAGTVHGATVGPAGYALAYEVLEEDVEPLVLVQGENGLLGYQSIVFVRADKPYESLDDLRGTRMAFGDPNSTSSYLAPSYYMRQEGKNPDDYFSQVTFAGSDETTVMGILRDNWDAGAAWYRTDNANVLAQMAGKGMIDQDEVRIIWKSPLLPSSPWIVRESLPQELKDALVQAFLDLPDKDPEAMAALDANSPGFAVSNHEMYTGIIGMRLQQLEERRRGGS
jgi:phosphonate transport system substrate-binding protein